MKQSNFKSLVLVAQTISLMSGMAAFAELPTAADLEKKQAEQEVVVEPRSERSDRPRPSKQATAEADAEPASRTMFDQHVFVLTGEGGLHSSNFDQSGNHEHLQRPVVGAAIGGFVRSGYIGANLAVAPGSYGRKGLSESGLLVDNEGNPVSDRRTTAEKGSTSYLLSAQATNFNVGRFCNKKEDACGGFFVSALGQYDSRDGVDNYGYLNGTLRFMKLFNDGKYFVNGGVGIGGASGSKNDIFGLAVSAGAGARLNENGSVIAEASVVEDFGNGDNYKKRAVQAALAGSYDLGSYGGLTARVSGEKYIPYGSQDPARSEIRGFVGYGLVRDFDGTAANAK